MSALAKVFKICATCSMIGSPRNDCCGSAIQEIEEYKITEIEKQPGGTDDIESNSEEIIRSTMDI